MQEGMHGARSVGYRTDNHIAANHACADKNMDITTHLARVTAPISYMAVGGRQRYIPVGPCLIESRGGPAIDITWGTHGQSSIALPREKIDAATDQGQLVLLD
jgi:hypothetical protein